jgi:hypothetical protein
VRYRIEKFGLEKPQLRRMVHEDPESPGMASHA